VLAWVKKPGSPLTWVTLPFFLTHCVLAHKELRFLFPLVLSAPFLGFLALQQFPAATRWLFHTRPGRSVWVTLTVLNASAFAIRMLIPARQEIGVQRAIYNSTPKRLLTLRGKDPFIMGGLPSYFYRDPDLRTLSLTDASGPVVAETLRQPALLVTYPLEPADTADLNCEILYRTVPVWAQREPVWSRLQWAEPQPWTLARCVAR
jgi:phosphatidylinositol glycan class B